MANEQWLAMRQEVPHGRAPAARSPHDNTWHTHSYTAGTNTLTHSRQKMQLTNVHVTPSYGRQVKAGVIGEVWRKSRGYPPFTRHTTTHGTQTQKHTSIEYTHIQYRQAGVRRGGNEQWLWWDAHPCVNVMWCGDLLMMRNRDPMGSHEKQKQTPQTEKFTPPVRERLFFLRPILCIKVFSTKYSKKLRNEA